MSSAGTALQIHLWILALPLEFIFRARWGWGYLGVYGSLNMGNPMQTPKSYDPSYGDPGETEKQG